MNLDDYRDLFFREQMIRRPKYSYFIVPDGDARVTSEDRINDERRGDVGRIYGVGQARAEVIRKRMRTLEQELFQLERWGEDDFPNNTVLRWVKRYPGNDGEYHYAAIKANDSWYRTGVGESPTTWDQLVQHWADAGAVEQVYVAADWLTLAEYRDLRTSIRQMNDGDGVELDVEKLRVETEKENEK